MDHTIKGTLTADQEKGLAWRRLLNTAPRIPTDMTDEDALFLLAAHQCSGFAESAKADEDREVLEVLSNVDSVGREAILTKAREVAPSAVVVNADQGPEND